MGTINYFTSDYITLGIRPYDYEDYEDENGNPDYQAIQDDYDADYENAEYILNEHDFYYYHIELKPGYYEGFSLFIENNYEACYNDWTQRREAQKEITEIKGMLIELAGCSLVACYPGWCTSYEDYNGTIKKINEAIKEMREEVKRTPTWLQLERAGETA